MASISRAMAYATLAAGPISTASCVAATPPATAASTLAEDRLRSVERERLRALVVADIRALERLHADDFQAISPFGSAFATREYLHSVASGELDYIRWEPEDIQVRLHGAVAALRYRARVDVLSRGTLLPTMQTWNTAFYERRDGRWVIVWFQVTQISPPPR